jgi:hypothetical protein
VHEQPQPTDEEQEQGPEHVHEEETKSAPGYENPGRVEPEDRG